MSDHIKTGLIGGPSDGMLLESNRQMARELQSLRTRLEAAERERDEARAQAIKEGERLGELVAEQVVYRARIRELELEVNAANRRVAKVVDDFTAKLDRTTSVRIRELMAERALNRARIRELEEALRPFAEEAATWADTLPGNEPVYTAADDCFVCSHCGEGSGIERAFTVGDLRRARELVTPAPAQPAPEGGDCTSTCRTVTQQVNSDWCHRCRRHERQRADTEALPFCACGRRTSECDGSRAGCGKISTPTREEE